MKRRCTYLLCLILSCSAISCSNTKNPSFDRSIELLEIALNDPLHTEQIGIGVFEHKYEVHYLDSGIFRIDHFRTMKIGKDNTRERLGSYVFEISDLDLEEEKSWLDHPNHENLNLIPKDGKYILFLRAGDENVEFDSIRSGRFVYLPLENKDKCVKSIKALEYLSFLVKSGLDAKLE